MTIIVAYRIGYKLYLPCSLAESSCEEIWVNHFDSGNTLNGRSFHFLKFFGLPPMLKLKLSHFKMGTSNVGDVPRTPQL